MDAQVVAFIPLWLDVVAVAVSALVGGLIAARERFDFNGVVIVAILTGLGGGIVRDLLIGARPVAITSVWLLPTAAVVGILVFLLSRPISLVTARFRHAVLVLDALALAVYTVSGAAKAVEAGLPVISCILVGVVTGVGGGILRDVLLNRQPSVLRPGALEATASLMGAIAQVLLGLVVPLTWAAVAGFVLAAGARMLSVWLGWATPASPIARGDDEAPLGSA